MAKRTIDANPLRGSRQRHRALIKKKPFIAGLWKFKKTVSLKRLVTLAENWAKTDPGYFQLFIRQVGNGENGIAFIYQTPTQIPLEDYLRNTSQELKRDFRDDLAGWDVASSLSIIK